MRSEWSATWQGKVKRGQGAGVGERKQEFIPQIFIAMSERLTLAAARGGFALGGSRDEPKAPKDLPVKTSRTCLGLQRPGWTRTPVLCRHRVALAAHDTLPIPKP